MDAQVKDEVLLTSRGIYSLTLTFATPEKLLLEEELSFWV